MVQGGMKCIKYILFLFNLIFVALGIVLLAVGISTKTGFSKHLGFIDPEVLSYPPDLFIAAGAIIFIIAFLGCWGSWKESHCMMITYSVLLGLLLILELGAAFSAIALEDDVEEIFTKGMTKSQEKYGLPNESDITTSWNAMQTELHCCGTHNYTDWKVNNMTHIPDSCCIDGTVNCTTTHGLITWNTTRPDAMKYIYVDGCWGKLVNEVTLGAIGIIGIVLAAVELLGVIFACLMARSIRHSYETV